MSAPDYYGVLGLCKCPNCGRVCAAVTEASAVKQVVDYAKYLHATPAYLRNAHLYSDPNPPDVTHGLYDFMYCRTCQEPAYNFLPAGPDEAPQGTTLQAVIRA